jgi:hypothetical protein
MISLGKFFRLLGTSSCFLLTASLASSCVDLSPEYGIVNLKISPSQEVYFKREVRGLNYDVLVLSPSSDHCEKPNPKSDYIFRGGPAEIYYKIEDGALTLFLTIEATPPESGSFPIKIVQNKVHPLDFVDLKKNYENRGLKRLDVKIDKMLKCK